MAIDPREFTEEYDSPIFNQVTTLELDACCQYDSWVEQFFARNIVNCNTVTRLNCKYFGDEDGDEEMAGKEFLDLLSRFINLKHLKLQSVWVTDDVTAQDILNVCPNVIGLGTWGGNSALNA
eukprot:123871_1